MENPPLSSSAAPISVSSLIATLHQTFTHAGHRSLRVDSTTNIVIGPNVEAAYITAVWNHAFRRLEDQAILVVPTHNASPTAFFSAVANMPGIDRPILQAINVLLPFFTALTPENLSTRFHNGLGVQLSLNARGEIVSTRIQISNKPFASLDQLLKLPAKSNNRVFDVFYHLLLGESERSEYLSLKSKPEDYELLRKSGTYFLPDWVAFSDDYALAKDWSDALRQCGFKGEALIGLLSTLSGILLLGNKSNPADVTEGCALLGISPQMRSSYSFEKLIAEAYVALVETVVAHLNKFLSTLDLPPDMDGPEDMNEVISIISIVECAEGHKKYVMRNVFDNETSINAELVADGRTLPKMPAPVNRAITALERQSPVHPSTYVHTAQFRQQVDASLSYLSNDVLERQTRFDPLDFEELVKSNRLWTILNVSPCGDAHGLSNDTWSSSVVSAQLRSWFVTEWSQKRRAADFTADYDYDEFIEKYISLMPPNITRFTVEDWARDEQGYAPEDMFCGKDRIWISEPVWRDLELGVESGVGSPFDAGSAEVYQDDYANFNSSAPLLGAATTGAAVGAAATGAANPFRDNAQGGGGADMDYPYTKREHGAMDEEGMDEDVYGFNEDYYKAQLADNDIEAKAGNEPELEVVKMTARRRFWVTIVWLLTWWIPSPVLKYIARMKRREIRMAWREKLVICFFIFLINAGIIFYMLILGTLICPDYDKVWNSKEVGYHQGTDDYYVSVRGSVYDLTKFYKLQHSDTSIETTSATMMYFAGQDVTDYFPPPLTIACPELVTDETIKLVYNTTKSPYTNAMHYSGEYYQSDTSSKLYNWDWYWDTFEPAMKTYYKGRLVATRDQVADSVDDGLYQVIIDGNIYDLTNYFLTIDQYDESESSAYAPYNFFADDFVTLVQQNAGSDITDDFNSKLNATTKESTMKCLNNVFQNGILDFRQSARCQAANYILLVIAGILTSVTVIKFLASIRFGTARMPSPQDKFVICQVPAYTENEDELRLAIDSLTNLKYDNRRKLLLIICDGMITGAGNDRPTPRIVLDILGVDDKVDAPALPYYAVGEGSKQLNYGKVYSGLYENEGNIVPFMVVVKVGNEHETSKPGNRGKRDSQILVMNFLNRVHYQRPMNPLELEMFHQLNNVIGVYPELYEYIFMIDADTMVMEDALTRLVAACTRDSKIAGICGETGVANEERSWSTMIQVYEYFISHHLTKAFESLFGSVTCLPGCFSLYRLKSAKLYKPLIISDEIIRDYSVNNVDTLHKKNLFSLGEDRYLTTLMAKYFPKMKFSFVADAKCLTNVPQEFNVLLSQRRRWINSTVHNLVELLRLNNMCGFCCFGMRGVVFIDLIGTLMLPSVVVYLVYLIYKIASHDGQFPIISIVLIGAVYGLQALVFILRRQWQHVGWMIIYIAAYPIHSFLLPIYSFWNMDNFSWGNTRIVLDEKNGQKVVVVPKEEKFDPASVPRETWASYANRNGLSGAERPIIFNRSGRVMQEPTPAEMGYDMDEFTHVRDMRDTQSFISPTLRESVISQSPVGGSLLYDRRNTLQSDPRFSNPFASRMSVNEIGRPMSAARMSVATGLSGFTGLQPALDEDTLTSLRHAVKTALAEADMDNTTKRQLRESVQDMLDAAVAARVSLAAIDEMIDEELENIADEEEEMDNNDNNSEDKDLMHPSVDSHGSHSQPSA